MRKRVAIFTHGGIGTGNQSQGFPLITQIVNRLAQDFEITVFSLAPLNPDFNPQTFQAFSPPAALRPSMLRWLWLIGKFIRHNSGYKQEVLYSFWGYPTGFVMVVVGILFRKKTIVNLLGSESANLPEINYGFLRKTHLRKLVLWTCHQATELVVVSHYQIRMLKPYGFNREVRFIPWGSDREMFYPQPKTSNAPLNILHVANLNEVKDQETLLRAFQLIRSRVPAKLRMVGPDFMNGKIQQRAKELNLGDDVEFKGLVSHNQIAEHYHWAHLFMLTSLSEGQNNSIGEAMMCGLVPASTSVGIMDELQDAGVVVKPGDFKSLADGVVDLYLNPVEWEKRRQRALQWSTQYDLNWTVTALKDLLNES